MAVRRDENYLLRFFALFIGLYNKKDDDILANHIRGQLVGVIKARPGIIFADIKKLTGVHNGVSAYHLNVLEREGLITSKRSPLNKRSRQFFPAESELKGPYYRLTRIQHEIIRIINDEPGITISKMATKLGVVYGKEITHQRVDYNVQRLYKVGCLRRELGIKNRNHWYVIRSKLPEINIHDVEEEAV